MKKNVPTDIGLWSVPLMPMQGTAEARILLALEKIKKFFIHVTPSEFIKFILKGASPSVQNQIVDLIQSIDHVGFIAPPSTDNSSVNEIFKKAGFPDAHQNFSSTLLAQELGKMLGVANVQTEIFKCASINNLKPGQTLGVEIFVPSADATTVEGWITSSVGTHVAVRVKKRAFVEKVKTLLLNEGLSIPAFLKNQSMENASESSLSIYFDLNEGLRVEFYYIGTL